MTSLVAAVEGTRYGVNATGRDGYEADNPAQHFRAAFGASGVEVRPSEATGGWRVGLRLRAWGYGERLDSPGAAVVAASGNRTEYSYLAGEHGEALTEWYVNTARGIEQGFTLSRPPAGPAPELRYPGGPSAPGEGSYDPRCSGFDAIEQERIMLGLAAGAVGREEFTAWVRAHLLERGRT